MKEILTTKGQSILVDDDMYDKLVQHKWHIVKGKAVSEVWENGKRVCRLHMHRIVFGAKPGEFVRHIDGNLLNNQRANLTNKINEKQFKSKRVEGMRNEYETRGEQTVIFLNRRDGTKLEAIIDTDDLEKIKKISGTWVAQWSPFTRSFYVVMSIGSSKSRRRLFLHREILQPSAQNILIDHINQNTLDNRKNNLRYVSKLGNAQNTKIKSRHGRGVTWNEKGNCYNVSINYQGKQYHLGSYKDKEIARLISETTRKLIERIERDSLLLLNS